MTTETTPYLDVHALSCERGDNLLLNNLSFSLEKGQFLYITGPNGCGKTSLLRTLAGLMRIQAGDVYWQQQPIASNMPAYQQTLLYLGHSLALKANLSVTENVLYMAHLFNLAVDTNKITSVLTKLNLIHVQDIYAKQLSAGQRRRLAMAQLFLSQATVWLLDEPFTALDQAGQTLLIELLQAHIQQQGIVIMASHQPVTLADIHITSLYLQG